MAQPARPSSPKTPNPCAAFRPAPPLHARRPNATPWPARPKDASCPTSTGDTGHSGQLKKAQDNVIQKPCGGTYSKPEARVKLVPAEVITYVRHGKTFGRTVGSDNFEKRHHTRSITPPLSSGKVYPARSTPLTHKTTTPFSHEAATPLPHKSTTPLSYKSTTPLSHQDMTPPTHKATSPLAHKPTSPLAHKPMSPPPPAASCLSAKRSETAVNRKNVSLKGPLPLFKTVQRDAIPPAVFRKESEMNLISPSSVHVLPAHSSKVPLGTEVEPSSKSVSTLENTKLCSTSNQATLKCQRTNIDADSVVEKEHNLKPSLLSPTSVLSLELTKDLEAVPSTKSHTRNERETIQEASISCNMTSGAQAILHTELYKMPYQPESRVELSNDLVAVPFTKSHMRNERQTNQEASISCNVPSGAPLILHTELRKKTYRPDAWKGKFEVTGELTHTCDELEAHFSREIFIKVYEASKQMPEVLKLEALPLSPMLPKKFKMEPPNLHDIGLCFMNSHQRPNKNFDNLLENISSNIGLRTDIGTMELLIFSSKLLTEDDQTKDGKLFFCGVFRKPPRKKQHQANNHHTDNVDISNSRLSKGGFHVSEDIGMNSDMTEGKHIGSRCEFGMKLDETGFNKPDTPGFALDVPPGLTIAHRGLHTLDVPPGFTSAHRGLHTNDTITTPGSEKSGNVVLSEKKPPVRFSRNITKPVQTDVSPGSAELLQVKKESGLSAFRGLHILDVPPGFTSAHRGLHTNDAITTPGSEKSGNIVLSEKKTPTRFSRNITKPVQTDVSPGSTKLLQVKEEPGLPAFSVAIEKVTPIGEVNEKKIKHEKEDLEVDDGSQDREFPKFRRLTDIMGASSSNNASTSSIPRNCSEVCRSAAPAPSASEFQETGPADKEKLSRKRGQPEPSEPCAGEAAKRPKVKERMALNGSVALNSNGGKS